MVKGKALFFNHIRFYFACHYVHWPVDDNILKKEIEPHAIDCV
jgi:hypothetical protein